MFDLYCSAILFIKAPSRSPILPLASFILLAASNLPASSSLFILFSNSIFLLDSFSFMFLKSISSFLTTSKLLDAACFATPSCVIVSLPSANSIILLLNLPFSILLLYSFNKLYIDSPDVSPIFSNPFPLSIFITALVTCVNLLSSLTSLDLIASEKAVKYSS